MKIAVLAHSFPRFSGDTHGTFVKSLCEAVAALGHEVHVLVPFDPELRPQPDSPLHIHSFRYVKPDRWHLLGYSRTLRRDVAMKGWAYLQSPLYFFFAQRALHRLVKEQGIDLVHAHWHLPNGYVAWRVQRRLGTPFCVTLHGSDVFMAERNGLFRNMAAGALNAASHVTSCSADLQQRLVAIGQGRQPDKVLLVPNGTDLPPSREIPQTPDLDARLRLTDGERLLVAVGRMVDKKGFRYLLDAMPRILERHGDVRLVLGGGGDLQPQLEQQARDLGIAEKVDFPGMLSHPEVLALVARGELFVMPSVRDAKGNIDGLPIVVLEAMAAGTPVVATDLAGMPLAVDDGVSGRLVPEKDAAALADAIGELLDDAPRLDAMGKAAHRKVTEDLNWHAVARRHDALYRQAVDAS